MINQAAKLLKPNATLLLRENDGLKSYVKQASKLFSTAVNAKKHGKAYIVSIQLNAGDATALNDKIIRN